MTEIPLEQEQGFVLLDRDTLRSLFAIEKAARALVKKSDGPLEAHAGVNSKGEWIVTDRYYTVPADTVDALVRAVRGEGAP